MCQKSAQNIALKRIYKLYTRYPQAHHQISNIFTDPDSIRSIFVPKIWTNGRAAQRPLRTLLIKGFKLSFKLRLKISFLRLVGLRPTILRFRFKLSLSLSYRYTKIGKYGKSAQVINFADSDSPIRYQKNRKPL